MKKCIIISMITAFSILSVTHISTAANDALNEKLISRIESNLFDSVKSLLKRGANPNAIKREKRKRRRTALMIAAQKGNAAIVRLLLKHKAKVNALDRYGTSALMLAAEKGRYRVVQMLLKRRARVNLHEKIANLDTSSALLKSCSKGYLSVVKLLVRHGANVHKKNKGGYSALHIAAMNGQTHIVKFLLRKRVNVNVKSGYYSRTALMFAAQDNHADIVNLLLRHRARKYMYDYNGHTALHMAAKHGNIETIKTLLRYRFNINKQIFKKSGEGPPDKDTALICAVRNEQYQTVRYLVRRGAKVFIKNNRGRNALKVAEVSYKYARGYKKNIAKKVYLYLKRVARR